MAEKSVLVAVLEGRTPSIVIASDFCTETVFAEQSPEMAEKSVLEAVLEGRIPFHRDRLGILHTYSFRRKIA